MTPKLTGSQRKLSGQERESKWMMGAVSFLSSNWCKYDTCNLTKHPQRVKKRATADQDKLYKCLRPKADKTCLLPKMQLEKQHSSIGGEMTKIACPKGMRQLNTYLPLPSRLGCWLGQNGRVGVFYFLVRHLRNDGKHGRRGTGKAVALWSW